MDYNMFCQDYYNKLNMLERKRIQTYMSKGLLLYHIWSIAISKLKAICSSIGKLLPLFTFGNFKAGLKLVSNFYLCRSGIDFVVEVSAI